MRIHIPLLLIMTSFATTAIHWTVNADECPRPEKPCVTEIGAVPWTPPDTTIRPKVIYGADDRIDVYAETDPQRRDWAAATCALIYTSRLTEHDDGSWTISSPSAYRRYGLPPCEGEPFGDQPTAAYCTGFMVGTDLIVTAGHCYNTNSIENTRFIFGFWMVDETTPRLDFHADEVYQGVEVVSFSPSGEYDHSVVRVDRPIRAPGARPFIIRREGDIMPGEFIGVIGHPSGLPMKLAFGNTYVRSSDRTGFFVANLDTYGGNSGSPIINADTGILEGILVRGETDFVNSGSCFESNVVPDDGGRGEDVTKSTVFADFVPPANGHSGYLALDSEHYRCSDTMMARVVDNDLREESMLIVQAETTSGDIESFALGANIDQPGVFTGTLAITAGAPSSGSGSLDVVHGDIVTVYYQDDLGGAGEPILVAVSATIDCYPPAISDVRITQLTGTQTRIEFSTDEPAQVIVYYGLTCQNLSNAVSSETLNTNHALTISGMTPETRYAYVVEAVDPAGNAGYDDNGGACYSFVTVSQINYFTEYFNSANLMDIAYSQLTFIPFDHPNHYQACFGNVAALPMPITGNRLQLGDDEFHEAPLEHGAGFSFYGVEYDRLFVGSNGYITLGVGDATHQALPSQHFLLPRIAPLMCDLNPEIRGNIFVIQISDRYVVTFEGVPHYDGTGVYPAENSHTFQVELFFDGMVRITWLEVSETRAVVGLSNGMGTPDNFASINLSALRDCDSIEYAGDFHSADINTDWRISLDELLRIVQFYNAGAYSCAPDSPDGYTPGEGSRDCHPHDSDYAPANWRIDFNELLRAIQLYNASGYRPEPGAEDEFHPLP